MKAKITAISIFFNMAAMSAQSLSYRIDYYRPDSIYLVEIKSNAPTKPGLRAERTEVPILLQDTSEVSKIIAGIENQEKQLRNQADALVVVSRYIQEAYADLRRRLEGIKSKEAKQ